MPTAYVFWGLMIAWAIVALVSWKAPDKLGAYGYIGNSALVFVLLALLGWQIFGQPLK